MNNSNLVVIHRCTERNTKKKVSGVTLRTKGDICHMPYVCILHITEHAKSSMLINSQGKYTHTSHRDNTVWHCCRTL